MRFLCSFVLFDVRGTMVAYPPPSRNAAASNASHSQIM